jgi:hypothetical protein
MNDLTCLSKMTQTVFITSLRVQIIYFVYRFVYNLFIYNLFVYLFFCLFINIYLYLFNKRTEGLREDELLGKRYV